MADTTAKAMTKSAVLQELATQTGLKKTEVSTVLEKLTEHVLSDVLPILATLDRVGPEIHELLEVTRDVRQAILGFPGFGFLRRRGEVRLGDGRVVERTDDGSGPVGT